MPVTNCKVYGKITDSDHRPWPGLGVHSLGLLGQGSQEMGNASTDFGGITRSPF